MSSGLITRFLGQGAIAGRPADPDVAAGAIAFWWSTDTNQLSAWVEGAWLENILAGSAYTDEQARDVIGAALVAGANVTITVNDGANTITIDVPTVGIQEIARDALGTALTAGANVTLTVNDGADTITIDVPTAGLQEIARDAIGAALVAGAGITITPNDGADTITIAASGGGASTVFGYPTLAIGTAGGTNGFYLMRRIFCAEDMTINKVAFMTSSAAATCKYQPFVYACSTANVAGARIAFGAQVTGVTAGYNEAPLSSAANLVKGNFYYVGCCVIVADIANMFLATSGVAAFVGNGGSSVPADPCPAVSTGGGTLYGFWGVT